MAGAAGPLDASMLHLVVDQDVHEALTLQAPYKEGQRLSIQTVRLADHDAQVPTGAQPPVNPREVIRSLGTIEHDGAGPTQESFLQICRPALRSRNRSPWFWCG